MQVIDIVALICHYGHRRPEGEGDNVLPSTRYRTLSPLASTSVGWHVTTRLEGL